MFHCVVWLPVEIVQLVQISILLILLFPLHRELLFPFFPYIRLFILVVVTAIASDQLKNDNNNNHRKLALM